jgi:hypothetical protein
VKQVVLDTEIALLTTKRRRVQETNSKGTETAARSWVSVWQSSQEEAGFELHRNKKAAIPRLACLEERRQDGSQ